MSIHNLETFEKMLSVWNQHHRNESPWTYMGIDKETYFEMLLELSHKKQKEEREAMLKEDEEREFTGTFDVDEMSVVYFVLLLSAGAVAAWIVLMLVKAMFGGE